ncbi:MAG: DUF2817 domain-containing protein [Acidobacteria bacterium]|nr:DUF2817 domain-containing protein [Acidobacteriota bacterium]
MTISTATYFSSDYFAARSRFRRMAEKTGGRLESLVIDAKGPGNEDLSIDIGWFGAENPRRALLVSSGIHGVECFAGSAIQLQLLDNIPQLSSNCALVLVHALNPFGMAWLRRFNENNVDLNRNFLGDENYAGAPEAYAKVDPFLNPRSGPSSDFFLLKATWLVLRYGYTTLKQGVAGGQYEYPRGLFFGGKHLEQGPEKYQSFVGQRLSSVERIVVVDIHTGLGRSGEDTLLVEPEQYAQLRAIFGARVAPAVEGGPAYRVSGAMGRLFTRVLPKAGTWFLAQEFGTYPPLKILHALREENRWHHYGAGTLDHPAKRRLKEVFGPDDERWRRAVLERGGALVKQALEFLGSSPSESWKDNKS